MSDLPSALPEPPPIELRVIRDRAEPAERVGGFLSLKRAELVAEYPDGTHSEPFRYDRCDRKAIDAVVVVAHFVEEGTRRVYLRSCVRPPVAMRSPPDPRDHSGRMWEVVAGLIDLGETPAEAGARELGEELGVSVRPDDLRELGPWTYPSPGVIGERHVYFHVEVDPRTRTAPTEDGSPLERGAAIISAPLANALAAARNGLLPDAKTELALRRLAETLS